MPGEISGRRVVVIRATLSERGQLQQAEPSWDSFDDSA
jgi:hypothetical protein